ncbi:zinc finger protein 831 [Pelobates fuscus]|uniref:zinc finger protein 831 n=1 Tax=Pelobates fuscus TaxID=191477 RepID=UPI002FE48EF8
MENAKLSVMLNAQPSTDIQRNSIQTITLNVVNTLPILSAGYSSAPNIVLHGKSKNVGKHVCKHCGRDCLKPSVLEKHIRSHTGERPFPCATCGISFKTQSNLYKHRRTQTHVNNIKLSSAPSIDLKGQVGDQVGDNLMDNLKHMTEKGIAIDTGQSTQHTSSDTSFSSQENTGLSFFTSEDMSAQALNSQLVHGNCEKTGQLSSKTAIISPTVPNQKRMLKSQNSPSGNRQIQVQRQYETGVEKQWERSPSEYKLKKCESTDSGYLSHSDSADLQMFSGSPLHSLSECSLESEHALSTSSLQASSEDCDEKTLTGKKTLEEHITMLISRNQALVDDSHLDNVRPRKTTLSKQGSIDLPMPYTFKDSFHFDIKSLDVNRKKVSPCPNRSTFNPGEKGKPLFFHSVPTQFSTTMDNITMTRCNSLPFVESCRLTPDKQNSKCQSIAKQPLDASFASLLLTSTAAAHTVDFSRSHPRGLVRQTAVDEVPVNPAAECHFPEVIKSKKKHSSDHPASKCKGASKRGGSKKTNMFSHEKWQMYGDETFKKLYQNVEKNESSRKVKQEIAETTSLVVSENLTISTSKHLFKIASGGFRQEPSLRYEPQSPNGHHPNSTDLTQGSKTLHSGINYKHSIQKDVKVCTSEEKLVAYLSSSKTEFPQPLLKDQSVSASSSCVAVELKEVECKSPSNTEKCIISEKLHSERKKFKVAEIRDIPSDSNASCLETDSGKDIQRTFFNKYSLDQLQKAKVHLGVDVSGRTGLDTFAIEARASQVLNVGNVNTLSSNIKCNAQGSTVHLSGKTHSSGQFSYQFVEPPTPPNKNIFSPRYVIKLQSDGLSSSDVSAKRDCGHRMSFEDTAVHSLDSAHSKQYLNSVSVFSAQTQPGQTLPPPDPFKLNPTTDFLNAPSLNASHISKMSFEQGPNLTQYDERHTGYHNDSDAEKITDTQHILVEMTSAVAKNIEGLLETLEDQCPDKIAQTQHQLSLSGYVKTSSKMYSNETPNIKPEMESGGCEHKPTRLITGHSQELQLHLLDNSHPGQLSRYQLAKPITTQVRGIAGQAIKPLVLNSRNSKDLTTETTFSVLNTEPNPTWCWLNKSVPLPAEQKDKSFSVYASVTCNTMDHKRPGSAVLIPFQEGRPVGSMTQFRSVSSLSRVSQRDMDASSEGICVDQKTCKAGIVLKKMDLDNTQVMPMSSRNHVMTKSRHQKRCSAFRQCKRPTCLANKHTAGACPFSSASRQMINARSERGDHYKKSASSESGRSFSKQTMAVTPESDLGDIKAPRLAATGDRSQREDNSSTEKGFERVGEDLFLKPPSSLSPEMGQSRRLSFRNTMEINLRICLHWRSNKFTNKVYKTLLLRNMDAEFYREQNP